LRVRNDLNTEDVCESRPAVRAKGAKDEVLALLIEQKDPGEHGETGRWGELQ